MLSSRAQEKKIIMSHKNLSIPAIALLAAFLAIYALVAIALGVFYAGGLQIDHQKISRYRPSQKD
jgi:hypothetical protein